MFCAVVVVVNVDDFDGVFLLLFAGELDFRDFDEDVEDAEAAFEDAAIAAAVEARLFSRVDVLNDLFGGGG